MPINAEGMLVAYLSMEIALSTEIPTYSGGLGVLAGDTLRAAADLRVPVVGVSLLHRQGYFSQRLDAHGAQSEYPTEWSPERFLVRVPARCMITLDGRPVHVGAWMFVVCGVSGHEVPVYLLDTALEENAPEDRALTNQLYGGDTGYRLRQEAILGIAGVRMLRTLGHDRLQAFHMNEGHSALLTLALLEEQMRGRDAREATEADIEAVRQHCVFTTHTPVPAGHDQFPMADVARILGETEAETITTRGCAVDDTLNMTHLALFFARYVNGVAKSHGEVSRGMFPDHPINSITNGVHAVTWTSPAFQEVFDRQIPEWRRDNMNLRYAIDLPLDEIKRAHERSKAMLLAEVERRTRVRLDPQVLTVGFARRATPYKRADLFFADLERLKRIAREHGPLQVIYAGKAHPRDEGGKGMIRRVYEAAAALAGAIPVVYLEDYDMTLGKLLCAGVDLWLNTPRKPQEASGTSGMKAALNGVPSLSVLDGWWVEGHVEGVTGWSVGEEGDMEVDAAKESDSLYGKLEHQIVPMFYGQPTAFARVRRAAIALNGSFFNAQRMVMQYVGNAYRL